MSAGREPSCPSTGILACPLTDAGTQSITSPRRAVRPTAELLAAVRRNSALTNWLAVLPSLTSLSGSPA